LRLHFLGTGTSFGIPVVGCRCPTCASDDARDRRTRHAALISAADGATLLVDTPPELRLQLLAAEVPRLDAVCFTHAHADHIHGIDDLRVFSARQRRPLAAYANAATVAALRSRFGYIFDPEYRPPEGTTRPEIRLSALEPGASVAVGTLELRTFTLPHGDMDVLGFRVGDLGYVTDAKEIPEPARAVLDGVRVLVLNALWYGNPHPTHFNVEEAVAVAQRIGAERTFLTHLTHRVRHGELLATLPPGIEPAYDGLIVDLD
jgi:phosphoribosyl 1,2-cyclic phosphate phosphodiesterase